MKVKIRVKDKGDDGKRHTTTNNIQIGNVESYMYLGQRNSTRDKKQDNEIQRKITAGWTAFAKHCDIFKGNMLEATSLQFMCTSRNDIQDRNMGSNHSCKEQAGSHTNKDGKEYVKYHIPGQKNKHLGKRKNKGHRRDWTSEKTEVDLGRSCQQDTR